MAAWRKVAGTCKNGPCPAIHLDQDTGSVRMQGTRVESHVDLPGFEAMLEYTADEWNELMRQWQEQQRG